MVLYFDTADDQAANHLPAAARDPQGPGVPGR
jgi:hypothetical protein